MDEEEGESVDASIGIPFVQSAINNLSSLYTGYKDRQQRESHFGARLVFEHKLAKEQLKRREALGKSERRVSAYPLPDYGHLANLMPDDGLPAVLVSEIHNGSSKPSKLSVKPLITSILTEIEEGHKLLHECSGALKSRNVIEGKFQALELCVNEFYNRPAIIIYHESDHHSLHSYALLWNLFPWKRGIAWDQLKIADIELTRRTSSEVENISGEAVYPQKRTNSEQNSAVRGFITDACLSATCSIVDAYHALQGNSATLFHEFVQPLDYVDSHYEIYVRFLTYMTHMAAGQSKPNIYMLSPFMLWLEDELRLLRDAGYPFAAEEQPGGSIAMLVDIGSSSKVALWLSRSFQAVPPKVFLLSPHGEASSYDIDSESWSFGPHILDIVRAVAASY